MGTFSGSNTEVVTDIPQMVSIFPISKPRGSQTNGALLRALLWTPREIQTEHLACNAIFLIVWPINNTQEVDVVYHNPGPLEERGWGGGLSAPIICKSSFRFV